MNSQPEATKQPIDKRPTVPAFSGAEAHIARRTADFLRFIYFSVAFLIVYLQAGSVLAGHAPRPRAVTQHVIVKEPDGAPVAAAVVTAFSGANQVGGFFWTDTNGNARLALPPRLVRFRVQWRGREFWSSGTDHCQAPCGATKITVAPGVDIRLVTPKGEPLAKAFVIALDENTPVDRGHYTDERGIAKFAIFPGRYAFQVEKDGVSYRVHGAINIEAQSRVELKVFKCSNCEQVELLAFESSCDTGPGVGVGACAASEPPFPASFGSCWYCTSSRWEQISEGAAALEGISVGFCNNVPPVFGGIPGGGGGGGPGGGGPGTPPIPTEPQTPEELGTRYAKGSFPEVNQQLTPGEGYTLLPGHAGEQYGLPDTIDAIKNFARIWKTSPLNTTREDLYIGDISLRGGGYNGHVSHQDGRDVDLYLSRDQQFKIFTNPDDYVSNPQYNPAYTEDFRERIKNLVLLFSNPAVTGGVEIESCFFDDPTFHNIAVPGRLRLCQYSNGQSPPGARHIDHVHIRFRRR
jgi:hypothetical protein